MMKRSTLSFWVKLCMIHFVHVGTKLTIIADRSASSNYIRINRYYQQDTNDNRLHRKRNPSKYRNTILISLMHLYYMSLLVIKVILMGHCPDADIDGTREIKAQILD